MKTKYKDIEFQPTILNGIWNCLNRRHRTILGTVAWDHKRKQWVFCPESDVELKFTQACHVDIADFLGQLNEGGKPK